MKKLRIKKSRTKKITNKGYSRKIAKSNSKKIAKKLVKEVIEDLIDSKILTKSDVKGDFKSLFKLWRKMLATTKVRAKHYESWKIMMSVRFTDATLTYFMNKDEGIYINSVAWSVIYGRINPKNYGISNSGYKRNLYTVDPKWNELSKTYSDKRKNNSKLVA